MDNLYTALMQGAMIVLGLCLFSLIAGEQETSIYSAVKGVWNTEIQARTLEDGL